MVRATRMALSDTPGEVVQGDHRGLLGAPPDSFDLVVERDHRIDGRETRAFAHQASVPKPSTDTAGLDEHQHSPHERRTAASAGRCGSRSQRLDVDARPAVKPNRRSAMRNSSAGQGGVALAQMRPSGRQQAVRERSRSSRKRSTQQSLSVEQQSANATPNCCYRVVGTVLPDRHQVVAKGEDQQPRPTHPCRAFAYAR